MPMSHFCRGTSQDSQESWRSWGAFACIWGAFKGNVAYLAGIQLALGRKIDRYEHGMTRRVQGWARGKSKASPRRTWDEFKANTRCFKAEHETSPRRTRGRRKSAWSWLEVGLDSAWSWVGVGPESAWSRLAAVWEKFKNSNLKNFDSWIRIRAEWVESPHSSRSRLGFPHVSQGLNQQESSRFPLVYHEILQVNFLSLWSVYDRKRVFWQEGNNYIIYIFFFASVIYKLFVNRPSITRPDSNLRGAHTHDLRVNTTVMSNEITTSHSWLQGQTRGTFYPC